MRDRLASAIPYRSLLSMATLVAAAGFLAPVPGTVTGEYASPPDTVIVAAGGEKMSDVAFSPDGNRVATSALDGRVHLWDAATGEALRTLPAHRREAYAVAFSPDGSRLATGGYDGSVRLWDPDTGQLRRSLKAEPWPLDVAFSPEGDELLVAEVDGDLVVHSLDSGAADTLVGFGQGANVAAWSPAGPSVATAFSTILVQDRETGTVTDTLRGHGHVVQDLAFTPDGNALVSGSIDASVRIWDLREGVAVDTLTTRLPAPFVAVSPTGERLATGGADRTVRLWRLDAPDDTGRAVARHDRLITGVAYSPCGDRVASVGLDGRLRIAVLGGGEGDCP